MAVKICQNEKVKLLLGQDRSKETKSWVSSEGNSCVSQGLCSDESGTIHS